MDIKLFTPVTVENYQVLKMSADGSSVHSAYDLVGSNNMKCHMDSEGSVQGDSTDPGATRIYTVIMQHEWSIRADASSPWQAPHFSTKIKTVQTVVYGAITNNVQDLSIQLDVYDVNNGLASSVGPTVTTVDVTEAQDLENILASKTGAEMAQVLAEEAYAAMAARGDGNI